MSVHKKGYLIKESAHLKRRRKRWIVLEKNMLYCYKSEANKSYTEIFDLSVYCDIMVGSNNKIANAYFELISSKKRRIFIAQTTNEMMDWVRHIKQAQGEHQINNITTHQLTVFENLINMGFDVNLSLNASKKYPNNINNA
eukprot:414316_1